MKKTAAKAIVVLALLIFAITGCGKAQKTEGQMPGKDTGTQMTANAWESADALKDALQKQYGFECETVGPDEWEGGNPAYFLTGYAEDGGPYVYVDIAYKKETNRVIYMEWYFDPENTTTEYRKEASCMALRVPDDIRTAAGLLDADVLPDYEKAELSDCMLYVMTIEEDGYTSFNVQFTDIR